MPILKSASLWLLQKMITFENQCLVWFFVFVGVTCPDPRIPPDGRQVNTTSYDEGDLVYFECERSGFSLSDPYPLLCELNNAGNGLQWNGSVPACVGESGKLCVHVNSPDTYTE